MNRRAELQRKLAIAPVPKPPADLAKRIKSEIPEKLQAENDADRERLSESIALNLRVAASILVLISTAFLALHLFNRANEKPTTTVAVKREAAPAVLTSSVADNAASPVTPQPQKRVHAKRVAPPVVEENKPTATEIAEFTPPPPAPPAAKDEITMQAAAPAVRVLAAPASMAKKTASNEEDAVVQRYAAPDELPASISLDVEAVPNPFDAGKVIIRASVDSGIASSAWLEVMPAGGVANGRFLALSPRWGTPKFANSSRTTIVEVSARPEDLATVRLLFKPEQESSERTLVQVVHPGDVKAWSEASRRTKAAVLAALWRSGADPVAVAAKAREAGLDDLAREIDR